MGPIVQSVILSGDSWGNCESSEFVRFLSAYEKTPSRVFHDFLLLSSYDADRALKRILSQKLRTARKGDLNWSLLVTFSPCSWDGEVRSGWAEASRKIAAAGDDVLVWPALK